MENFLPLLPRLSALPFAAGSLWPFLVHTPGLGLPWYLQPDRDTPRGRTWALCPQKTTQPCCLGTHSVLCSAFPDQLLPSYPMGSSHNPSAPQGSEELDTDRTSAAEAEGRGSKSKGKQTKLTCIYTAKGSCSAVSPPAFTHFSHEELHSSINPRGKHRIITICCIVYTVTRIKSASISPGKWKTPLPTLLAAHTPALLTWYCKNDFQGVLMRHTNSNNRLFHQWISPEVLSVSYLTSCQLNKLL